MERKKRPYRARSQGQNQKDHTAQAAADVTIYFLNYLIIYLQLH